MNQRIFCVLLLAGGLTSADSEQDLKFAQALGARGMKEMALKVLTDLEQSSDPDAARAGRFGKAQLTKFEADLARRRFLVALEEGSTPVVTRDEVLAFYKEAKPKIEEYVAARPDNDNARFLLGELLQEYAEFLTGADYPDSKADERGKLVDQNKDEAAKLFEGAIDSFGKVVERLKGIVSKDAPYADENYVRLSQAEFNRGRAKFRWACVYPKGPHFINRIDGAIETLDDFLQRHYDEAFGAYAMIYLGRCFYEKALRLGEADEGDVALNYFENVYTQVEEAPSEPQTSDIIGEAFYWYAKTCNALARGEGNLKKPQPIYYQNSAKASAAIGEKIKQGAKRSWTLRARLELADADAAQGRFGEAVSVAGEVLAAARIEGHTGLAKLATSKLTLWVANVRGGGALDPSLLYQIGASLGAQGRTANAITFFEKAMTAARTEDEKEKVAYPAQLEIAKAYLKDKRYFAAASVAWAVVEKFEKAGADPDSDFGLTASEACYRATLAWRAIQDATNAASHQGTYQTVVDTFRRVFPTHPANSDKAYGIAIEAFTSGKFAEAAKLFLEISPNTPNYWRAQRRVPQCYRVLAQQEKDEAKVKEWDQKTLASAEKLLELSAGKPDDAKKAEQHALLYKALSEASLSMWKEALADIDVYLDRYPKLVKRGLEIKVKIDAHMALGELENAEAALKSLQEKEPGSPYLKRAIVDVYTALRTRYKETASGEKRRSMASRAADLWQQHMAGQEESELTQMHYFFLADALRDGGRYQEAGEAFIAASGLVSDQNRKAYFDLQGAEMTFKAAREGRKNKTLSSAEYLKILKTTRQLFTNVLIPDAKKQAPILKALGDFTAYPQKSDFAEIKRRPDVLLTAAEVYNESSQGTDGRWVAVRLIDYLHTFTVPIKDPSKENLDELITTWWDGAELKLEVLASIMLSSSGQDARVAKQSGYGYATKLMFQYTKMDGEERVDRIKALAEKLK